MNPYEPPSQHEFDTAPTSPVTQGAKVQFVLYGLILSILFGTLIDLIV